MGVLKLHTGPIHCVAVTEGYVVTGGEDGFVRVWPLDFSDYLMEAHHESPVSALSVSEDGLRLLVGAKAGTVGVLDVCTHEYLTLMRSHAGGIVALAHDPSDERTEFATASNADRTIRVWDRLTGAQRYEFASPDDGCSCLSYHPLAHVLAAGFESGVLRVFDVKGTSTLYEFQQHNGTLLQVLHSPNGAALFSASSDGHVCVHDALNAYQVRVLTYLRRRCGVVCRRCRCAPPTGRPLSPPTSPPE